MNATSPNDATPETPESRYRVMLEIARALGSTLDLDELLRRVMACITELLEAERSSLFLIDHERREIWSKIAEGEGLRDIRLPLGRGLAGYVAETGRTVNVQNAYLDPRFHADIDRATGFQTNALLAVPLRGKDGRVIGVAQALNKRGGAGFVPDDERTLVSISSLVGMALENARLYSAARDRNAELVATQDKLRQKVAEVDLLFEIEREISSASSPERLLEAILERAMATVSADAGALLLADEGGAELWVKGAPGSVVEVRRLHAMPVSGLLVRAAEAGEPVIAGAADARGSLAELTGRRAATLVCVPLLQRSGTGAAVVGWLELSDKLTGTFTADDAKLAGLVAAQLGRAMQLAKGRAEAERAQRLTALGQMLGGIVHDLRSPLTVVSGYAELMAREDDANERDAYARQILAQVDHASAMTREVLSFIRGERQLLVRRVHLGQFWKDLGRVLERELEGSAVRLSLDIAYDGSARFDEGKIKRLATNLARNAAQAMPRGGTVQVRCTAEADDLLLEVADDGPGIPPEVAPRLFSAFSTHGKAGGTGLGLAIVKEVVDAHGGQVSFTTAPGKGTRFAVRLPGAVQR